MTDHRDPMRVSVVIPAYNRAHLIQETVESVLRQSTPAAEVIVVDDGSTDGTAVVVNEFGPPVRCVVQQNGGPAAARNAGIRAARSPLIAFLDSDDLWHPRKLEWQLEVLNQTPDAALVFTGTETRNASLERTTRVYRPHEGQAGDAFSEILKECFVKTSSVLVRREVFDHVGYFNTNLFGPEDWELFARILSEYRVAYVPEPCVIYRKHEGSIQTNIERWAANDLKAMDLIFALPRARAEQTLLFYQRYRIHSEAGIGYFYQGRHGAAARHLLKALRWQRNPSALGYLLKCAMPAGLLAARRARRTALNDRGGQAPRPPLKASGDAHH